MYADLLSIKRIFNKLAMCILQCLALNYSLSSICINYILLSMSLYVFSNKYTYGTYNKKFAVQKV